MRFKEISVAAALCAACAAHASEWTPIASKGDSVLSIDRESIRREGKVTKAWALVNYNAIDDAPQKDHLSEKWLVHVKCGEGQLAFKRVLHYEGNNGAGRLVRDATQDVESADFKDMPPDTGGEKIMAFACKQTFLPNNNRPAL